jgi:hypothetical protein
MVAQGKTYKSLAKDLEKESLSVTERTLYRYITQKAVPSKSMKKAIAKALNCSVMEIF